MIFEATFRQAAKDVIGKKIVIGKREATVVSAQGFSKKENDAPLYEPILSMDPGGVYCPRYRNAILVLIACKDGVSPGGCVLIKEIKIGEKNHKGPGKVSEALGLTTHGATGRIQQSGDKLTLKI